ncbi:MAG TPA: glycoside hydrolase family 9 protein [Gemmatimonadaceae bacterium]|nr:glycoside hydrolase family 9 protein [Gemmatimonadaceae bacterium]
MSITYENSAEDAWKSKKVLASRTVESMTDPTAWTFTGTGKISFLPPSAEAGRPALRVDMDMFTDKPAPTRNQLSSVNLKRTFAGDDWTKYNRLSFWVRPLVSGFPMLPLQIVLHNDGAVKVPDAYYREGIHYVTLDNNRWTQVNWEITPLARDKITGIEIGYWVNKMLAQPSDRVAFEIGRIDLQLVNPDIYEGWSVSPGTISFSHSGYDAAFSKIAVANGLPGSDFKIVRISDPRAVVTKPIKTVTTRLGSFQTLDFSSVKTFGTYVIESGGVRTKAFSIAPTVWDVSIWAAINFFFGERCGFAVPGSHGVDHLDWFATHGDQRITMSGGWHDAGDLSQGLVNTGEAVYAMYALAEDLQAAHRESYLIKRVIEEANWGLDWVLKVKFDGGYRIGFASHNLWTNNIVGDADDRTREAKNDPNVNYIAAAAEAIAYRVLKSSDPKRARQSLATAEADWRYAIAGHEGPDTWATPAYAATPIELAGIGILASMELYRATGKKIYSDKAIELAPTIVESQQKTYVGSQFPLAGFFYTNPAKDTLFHQFHRANDQAPIVGLIKLIEAFPNHPDWMTWYSTVAMYSEYQKKSAQTTEPWGVLPAYVYTDKEYLNVPEKGGPYNATREAFREQVLGGMPMGDGYYLKAFPVWFARRGNYGVLLSQAKALSAASLMRNDSAGLDLAEKQAQWVIGRNPFGQSTMYGEGYNWAQQYSVSSGDFVGSLPVGMQSRGTTDLPYWPSQNMYVYKEVWVHPVARWIWLMGDLAARHTSRVSATSTRSSNGDLNIQVGGTGKFDLQSHNLNVTRTGPRSFTARIVRSNEPWVAVAVSSLDPRQRAEVLVR